MEDRLDQIDWPLTLQALKENGEPMSWNLLLAFIPLALSCLLFNPPRSCILSSAPWILMGISILGCYSRFSPWLILVGHPLEIGLGIAAGIGVGLMGIRALPWLRSMAWGVGVILFVLFLPNAAYVLTDLIHLIFDIRKGYPMATVVLFLIPQYVLFILSGLEAHVISIINVGTFMSRYGWDRWVLPVEILLNGLTGLAIYWGRFLRINSWEVLTAPGRILTAIVEITQSPYPRLTIAITVMILLGLYGLFKWITLALVQQHLVQQHHVTDLEIGAQT